MKIRFIHPLPRWDHVIPAGMVVDAPEGFARKMIRTGHAILAGGACMTLEDVDRQKTGDTDKEEAAAETSETSPEETSEETPEEKPEDKAEEKTEEKPEKPARRPVRKKDGPA